MLLLEIRGKTIAYASHVKKSEICIVKKLELEIVDLERDNQVDNYDQIKTKQDILKSIREKRLQGTLIRSRARWIESGEKGSKYFCNLENRNFVSKRMNSLILNNGEETADYNIINSEVLKFYTQLYQSKEQQLIDVDINTILNPDSPKLSDVQSNSLEGPITITEAGKVLFNMKHNKSPGSTGFTSEFFKCFWKDLGIFLIKSINCGFSKKELSITQKEGVITCIPKGTKSRKLIKNWRPISLLNVSYKIASGCIANRIKTILPSIINVDQAGFMADRFSGDNIRLVYDILNFSREHKKPGILLLIDFEKAFDSLAWSFIKKSLIYFNFKNDVIKWIETFYNGIKSTVLVNNSPTSWFPVERGCRQGDPISPYIFLLCCEVLAHMIRQNENIKGYRIFNSEIKISQFADDTSLFLDGSQNSFEYCIETILEYAKYSGLAMNLDKTKVVCFGCEQPPNNTYLPHLNLDWNPTSFNLLGVEFTTDLVNIADINIHKKLTEISNELNQWSKRDLTPYGKIVVIKTLAVSKIVHLLIGLPSPSKHLLNEINKMFYSFLWSDKPDKIKRSVAKMTFLEGGLGKIDIDLFDQSLKLTWIRRLLTSTSKWKEILEQRFPQILDIINYGDVFTKTINNDIKNPFWKDVTKYFHSFTNTYQISSKEESTHCSFLYNSNIKIGNTTIKDQVLINNNIFFIKQLMHHQQQRFLNLQEFNVKYNIRYNFLRYNSIIAAVRTYISKAPDIKSPKKYSFQPHIDVIISVKRGASVIYKTMIKKDFNITGFNKWNDKLQISLKQWVEIFTNLKQTTKDTKLHWIQFRITHHILTTNRSVAKFNKDQNHLCQFCNVHSETIHHLFWGCDKVKSFWKDIASIFNRRCTHAHNFSFDETLVIFGQSTDIQTDAICDLIILMAKFYIYRSKVQNTILNCKHFIDEVYRRFCIEKIINKNSVEFRNSWGPYLNIFKALQLPLVV